MKTEEYYNYDLLLFWPAVGLTLLFSKIGQGVTSVPCRSAGFTEHWIRTLNYFLSGRVRFIIVAYPQPGQIWTFSPNPDSYLPKNPDSYLPKNPDSSLPQNPDSYQPKNPHSYLPKNPDSYLPKNPDSYLPFQ